MSGIYPLIEINHCRIHFILVKFPLANNSCYNDCYASSLTFLASFSAIKECVECFSVVFQCLFCVGPATIH